MRRGSTIFFLFNLTTISFLVYKVWILLTLLVVDGAEDAITRAEVPGPSSSLIDERPQLIPKIIHQTYANESIPERWKIPQQNCIELHHDYEYKLWTDAKAREFIASE